MKSIMLYSARKKNAKAIEEYSVKCPDTNSDSASNKSKGDLPNSAVKLMAKINAKGKNANNSIGLSEFKTF